MRTSHVLLGLLCLPLCFVGCNCNTVVMAGHRDGSVGSGDGATGGDGSACVGIGCRVDHCTGGGSTTLTGTVYTPAGDLPLYNAIVYVPTGSVDAFDDTLSCARCDAALSGFPLVQTTTDTHGQFSLSGVPSGADVPLVIQIGRWRRQIVIPSVPSCTTTPLDAGMTRLPRTKAEGDIPRIALSTGGADALECLLRKIGIDDSEFTTETGTGRVNLYAGDGGTDSFDGALGGASFTSSQTFWGSLANLSHYDLVLLSCEGGQHAGTKPPAALQAMQDYTTAGGRVFASHWHNYWVEAGPAPFPSVANFNHQPDLADPFTAQLDTSFPKGAALAEWLVNVGGSATLGQVVIHAAQHTVDSVNPPAAQRWIYSDTPTSVQYFTFNTPVGADPTTQCGRFVVSDIHVSSGDTSDSSHRFPTGCTTTGLTAQEKVLVFMLFDLSSCITMDMLH